MCTETLHRVIEIQAQLDEIRKKLNGELGAIKIKKLDPNAIIPRKATQGSAAYDVFLPAECELQPGRQVIPLGFALELPLGYEAKIEPRSGFSSKGIAARLKGIDCRINADVIVGKIDSDYRGEIGVIVKSNNSAGFTLPARLKIAQMTIYHVESAKFVETEELSDTDRGWGGFGSTGSRYIN